MRMKLSKPEEQAFLLFVPGMTVKARVHQVVSVKHFVIEDGKLPGPPDVPETLPDGIWVQVGTEDVDQLHALMAAHRLYFHQGLARWVEGEAWQPEEAA